MASSHFYWKGMSMFLHTSPLKKLDSKSSGIGPLNFSHCFLQQPQNRGKTKGRADQALLVQHCLCWAGLGRVSHSLLH